ncbi:MAG: hypothetical protein WA919_11770 [Coleofasciculaceae cyanobacterium]
MTRIWQFWWHNLMFVTQYNPPELIEHLMTLSTIALGLWWGFFGGWPVLVLSASFAMGAGMSLGVREMALPPPHRRLLGLILVLLLLSYSLSAFAQLKDYL